MFNGEWYSVYSDLRQEDRIVLGNNITPSGMFMISGNAYALQWYYPALYDIGTESSNAWAALPSIACRICYNDWIKIASDLMDGDDINIIKLIPTEELLRSGYNYNVQRSTKDYRIKELSFGDIDKNVEYDPTYFNTHYFEDKNDSYAILKQYSYKDAGNNIQRVQELIDPSYGHVYIRSTNHRAWTSLAPGSNDAMIDLLRKMDRVNNYLTNNPPARAETIYAPFPQNNSWEGSAGVYQRGARNICVKFKYFDKVYVSREVTLGNDNPVLATTTAHPESEPKLYIKSSSPSEFKFCDINGNPLSENILSKIEVLEVTEK